MKTSQIKKVLIALDYDLSAQKVAEVGYSFVKTMGAETVLLHVIADPANYSSTEHVTIMGFAGHLDEVPLPLDSSDGLKKIAHEFLDKSKQHLGDKTIKTLIKEGGFAESILTTAKAIHADVIVMGSHGRKRLGNTVIGSVTKKVLYHTTIPVLIIPTKKEKLK